MSELAFSTERENLEEIQGGNEKWENVTKWGEQAQTHMQPPRCPGVVSVWCNGWSGGFFSLSDDKYGRCLLCSPQLRFLLQLWTAVPSHFRSIYCLPRVYTFTPHLWDLGRSLLHLTLCIAWASWEKFPSRGTNQHGSHKIAASPRPSLGEQFCSSSCEGPVGLGSVAHSSH